MSKITVLVFSTIKQIIGKKQLEMKAETVEDLLGQLFRKYGEGLESELTDNTGQLKKVYRVIINGRNVNLLNGLETKLKEGDLVAIVPAVAGG
ncbi:MAG: ubiquitin-like small modifier protein 1 [Candidatus Heimdallarchaeaceae archaeon]